MKTKKRFEIYGNDGIFFAYDRQQDIFVNRNNQPDDIGFWTRAEAKKVVDHLNKL